MTELFVDDWEKWMKDHHIKLRGDPRDNRTNEDKTDQSISEPKVEAESNGNG